MIQFFNRFAKSIAWFFFLTMYAEVTLASRLLNQQDRFFFSAWSLPTKNDRTGKWLPQVAALNNENRYNGNKYAKIKTPSTVKTGGPTQPEMQAFQSVNANNMVDLFSGDFSYNIPLMDVGGYPINIAYRSGISMDQESSWVGLGWNINPGTITRNMRGLPDDFDGKDSIRKTMSIKENKTIGVNVGVGFELKGLPIGLNAGLGVFHNTYKGWGLETSLNASITAGSWAKGSLSGGLSLTNNTDEGFTMAPSISVKMAQNEDANTGASGTFSLSSGYNNRYGIKGLQMSAGIRQSHIDVKNQKVGSNPYTSSSTSSGTFSSAISFASPSYSPSISMPYTSKQFTYTAKIGGELFIAFPDLSLSGYVSSQYIAEGDKVQSLPAFGYLYYQDGARNAGSLLDYNREKEMPYREKPAMPHIALPIYTYDAFSITGEGTGGMFRAYRGDIGFVYDHHMRTKDSSGALSGDVGAGNLVHLGVDLNVNRTFTQNGPWLSENSMQKVINFKGNDKNFEAVYFRNPGEKSINSKKFYEAIGGDDVVAVKLFQADRSPVIQATNYLSRFRDKKFVGDKLLKPDSAIKSERDKRTQVISYLTAKEAAVAGLNKYIENYTPNSFNLASCSLNDAEPAEGPGTGLWGEYYRNEHWQGNPITTRVDNTIDSSWGNGWPGGTGIIRGDYYSIRWTGRIKAPATGKYYLYANTDDGVQVWINDSCIIKHIEEHGVGTETGKNVAEVWLLKDEFYNLKMEYNEIKKNSEYHLLWKIPGSSTAVAIPKANLYLPPVDILPTSNFITREKRINTFRKENHISEIDVLNNDGRRYVYGIPVYNLKQKETSFALDSGNAVTGLAPYENGVDNTTGNTKGKDNFFSSEETPAYAHSFLLTGILSSDYVDLTGNGITDDDLGDAVRINYSKISGLGNPYRWRLPYATGKVTYNEGLKTYTKDDKGSYIYGEKELWYLHSIQSKTMVATFITENRKDLLAIDEAGNKYDDGSAKRLKEINLYSKSDLVKYGDKAKPIKTVHFEYSYELCRGLNQPQNDSGKLTLKKIWFTYNGNKKGRQNPYVFNYNNKNERYNTSNYDRWGNFKDPLNNPLSTTSRILTNAEYPYALQDSLQAAKNAATWSLDSIYLPSGGSIKVDFESDDYAYVQNRKAMEMFRIVGLGNNTNFSAAVPALYQSANVDNRYVFVRVSRPVSSVSDIQRYYLKGLQKLYFKLFVRMPDEPYPGGYEYVPGYADLSTDDAYGRVNDHVIWIKLAGISLKGDEPGEKSPMAKTAIQFLRLNIPSKAYPGVEAAETMDVAAAVRLINAMGTNMVGPLKLFDQNARVANMAKDIDTSRSFVRLQTPYYKKLGGGHRVKRITIYDNWDKMTGQRSAKYGQEYSYLAQKEIDGIQQLISSGVAIYEPGLGGEENPFHLPIEYVEKIAPLGPVTLGYSEEPLGESLFPSPSIGYSKVRVRTINYKNIKSANGYEETNFYTAYDFPTFTDRSIIDASTKKRYKPVLSNFLRINAKHFLAFSQGFKVELNDMHGKLRSQATYAEGSAQPVTYTENIYRVENRQMDQQRLNNTVTTIQPDGSIDTTAVIGKDVELMVDMREQLSVNNGDNIHLDLDMFAAGFFPVSIPSFYLLPQREENKFRSVAALKVIQRYGILDSVIHIDKGSTVTTHDLMYDSETGDALLTRTQNEFNDPVYNFSYPSHWAYDGMGMAYKNIGVTLTGVNIRNGKMIGSNAAAYAGYFSPGDEILVSARQKADALTCTADWSTFPAYAKIWALDSNVMSGGTSALYFIDRDGKPYSGSNIAMRIVRSGRRNINGSVGSITSLDSLVRKNPVTHQYQLALDSSAKIVSTSAGEFNQLWKVSETRKAGNVSATTCNYDSQLTSDSRTSSYCDCLRPFFNYLTSTGNLFVTQSSGLTVGDIAAAAGVNVNSCAILQHNAEKPYYALTSNTVSTLYQAMFGDCKISLWSDSTIHFNTIDSVACYYDSKSFSYKLAFYKKDTIDCKAYTIRKEGNTGDSWNYTYTNCSRTSVSVSGIYNNEVDPHTTFAAICALPGTISTNNCTVTIPSTDNCEQPSIDTAYNLDLNFRVDSCFSCTTINSSYCYNPATDTSTNPYTYGVLGNWRAHKSYTYYGQRATNDSATVTNIRRNGTFQSFRPFWVFSGNKLVPQYDTSRWVWNSEITQFNKKGFEIENKDPLGRYNAGLYGYNLTLPIAVIQNSKVRESGFDGFEDYSFVTGTCDTACSPSRHFGFNNYASKLDATIKHSGQFSLRLNGGDTASISFQVATMAHDTTGAKLRFTTQPSGCPEGTVLKDVKMDSSILLPGFSPLQGDKMVVSAWVREAQACSCVSYTKNRIRIIFDGGGTPVDFRPAGSIIEGWQRYEGVFTIPDTAKIFTLSLQSTDGSTQVNFDDVRVFPFNGNMKSFVYNPINLRLMAELDENNYATFYEYDDDGTLARVKKETERGIQTIKETRSALIKQ